MENYSTSKGEGYKDPDNPYLSTSHNSRKSISGSATGNSYIPQRKASGTSNMGSLSKTPIFQIGDMETSSDDSNTSSPSDNVHFVFPDVTQAAQNPHTPLCETPRNKDRSNKKLMGKPGYLGGHYHTPTTPQSRQPSGSKADVVLSSRRISTSSSENSLIVGNKILSFTRRQWLTLIVFGFVEFFSAIVISLQAPFYPPEAEKKGATATEYGFVFGVFELTAFIVSPIYGYYMRQIGPKLVFNLGIFVTATCSILFGFLDHLENSVEFISLSMVTRIFEALGDAAFVTASFVIIASEFPESVATTFATMETFYGLGLIVGPTVGGALYQWGGFSFPFQIIGGVLFVTALMTYFVMPSTESLEDSEDESNNKQSCFAIFTLLRIPSIAMSAFAIVSASMSIGFLSSTLEPHLRQFGLSPVVTGLVFIASGGMYALTAPIVGYICDKIKTLNFVMQMGSIFIICGFLLIGPAPFIPLEPNLWIIVGGLVIHGVGLGGALVAGFVQALREAVAHGFPDNVATYGVVSSIWTSMFAFGSFLGPSVAGVLFDLVGFRVETMFVVGVQLVGTIAASFFVYSCSTREGSNEETNSLLSSKASLTLEDELKPSKKSKKYGAVA